MGKYSIVSTPRELSLDLAMRLKALRKEAGYSQAELAERSGVSLGSLRRFEKEGKISLGSFLKLLVILNRLSEVESLLLPIEDLSKVKALFERK